MEIKAPLVPYGKNTISHIISAGAAQANHVIIDIADKATSEFELFKKANSAFKIHRNLGTVEFRHRGKFVRFDRK